MHRNNKLLLAAAEVVLGTGESEHARVCLCFSQRRQTKIEHRPVESTLQNTLLVLHVRQNLNEKKFKMANFPYLK